MKMHPNSVHLLVVLVNWENSKKNPRFGLCTRYLAGLVSGDIVTGIFSVAHITPSPINTTLVSVKPSVMTLPPIDAQPIVMAGPGTGMAPFRAFIQVHVVQLIARHVMLRTNLYFLFKGKGIFEITRGRCRSYSPLFWLSFPLC